jgi:Glycosyl transferase family 11
MIATRLMGGLGNQMFQYAAGRRLAIKRGVELVLDLSYLANQPRGDVPRHFELDCFHIVGKHTDELADEGHAQTVLRRLLRRSDGPHRLKETGARFQSAVLDAPDNTLLVGYWQSEKYFEDEEAQIRRDFTFAVPMSPAKSALATTIGENAVSLHIRRGDYVSHPASSTFHGVLPLEYYDRAAAVIAERIDDPHFFVISDDPGWCRTHVKLPSATTFVGDTPGPGHEDMQLMSLCRHHVIANSSFSWWGAWLNEHADKIVVAPRRWFTDEAHDARDLVPESWIRI